MKRRLGSLATIFFSGALVLGLAASVGAQQAPPSSQQPMEIPAQQYPQYPPPPQGAPPQYGAPQAGDPQQQAQSDSGAARLSYIHGDVSTQHNNATEWDAATLNTPLVPGDHVSTGKDARAEIELDHANILRMSEQATANIVNLSPSQMQLQIGQGLVNYEVMKGSDAAVEIQTPNVAIHPQAGEGSFRIQVNSDGETIVDVRKGSAEIATPQGSTRVDRNQRITIEGNADNAQYQVSGAPGNDDWDKWNNDRDHVITSAESWQHTNPYYTGSQDLDTYGQWNNVPDYGSVWFPAADEGWVPYRDGRWVFEPYYGWTWVSYEPWGWAPYHYGRWFVYGGRWGWWPGPVYGGYRPLWAPAYVSFLGFGGRGWGVGVGFGFGGGFGSIGWLPIGPGDRFYPWYGRGVTRVNVVNVYNVHGGGGFAPLREGPRAYSNVSGALSDDRLRGAISSMPSGQFGRGRVPMQQQRFDAASIRQASVMTGANPVSPSRESFRASDRQVNSASIPNRGATNQRFFSGSGNQRQGVSAQPGFNHGGPTSTMQVARPTQGNTPGQRSFSQSSPPQQQSQQGTSGWRSFSGSSAAQPNGGGARRLEEQGSPQPRTSGGYQQSARPGYSQQTEPSRQYQNYSRGSTPNGNGYSGYSRPQLNMQQPVVTPRTYSAPPSRSAPSGGSYGGGSRGGQSGGGSRGGSSGGQSSGGGHGRR